MTCICEKPVKSKLAIVCAIVYVFVALILSSNFIPLNASAPNGPATHSTGYGVYYKNSSLFYDKIH